MCSSDLIEQFCLAVLKPPGSCETLALRAIPVATRVVRDALMTAVAAPLDMAAERCRAAVLDRCHGAPPRGRQRRTMLVAESLAEVAEHIRHFQPLAGHGTRASGGHEVRRGWRDGVQRFQWTDGRADLAGGNQQILSRGAQIAMAEQ